MNSIRILFSDYSLPDEKSIHVHNLENILRNIQHKRKAILLRLIYRPEKLDLSAHKLSDKIMLDIHNYKNAVDLLKKEKPDLIFIGPTTSLVNDALSIAGKFLKIPVVCMINTEPNNFFRDRQNFINSPLRAFFKNSIPTDKKSSQKKFMRRGRFFLNRYCFLVKTQNAVGFSLLKKFLFFLFYLKLIFSSHQFPFDPRYSGIRQFLLNERSIEQLTQLGFKKSNLIVTGLPAFDDVFHQLQDFKINKKMNNKTQVLLAPDSLYEHSFWTKNQRDSLIRKLVIEFSKNSQNYNLIVKLHPSYMVLSEYENIIHSINPKISIYQKGSFLEFLKKSDILITFSSLSSTTVHALIAGRPIIICNPYGLDDDPFITNGLATECTNPQQIIDTIKNILSSSYKSEIQRTKFIKNYLYKDDGCASERISNEILNLLYTSRNLKL